MLNFDNIEDLVTYMFETIDNDEPVSVVAHKDLDSESWDISIEPAYNYEKEMYFGTDGYVLFHEDVNSKALIDMQNNENIEMSGHNLFTVDESDVNDDRDDIHSAKTHEDNKQVSTTASATYKINGKEVSKDRYESELEKIEGMYLDNMRDMLLGYTGFMDEMNEWRKILCW